MISMPCEDGIFLSFRISYLWVCLFFRQLAEPPLKQRKIGAGRVLPTELSTETVDAFPLVAKRLPLQQPKNQ